MKICNKESAHSITMALSLNIAMFQCSPLCSIVHVIILPVPDSFVLFLVQISFCAISYTFGPVIEYHNVPVFSVV